MTLDQIEKAIADLSPDQLAQFRAWFMEFDAKVWDEQLAKHAAAGQLDRLATEALADHEAGKSTPL